MVSTGMRVFFSDGIVPKRSGKASIEVFNAFGPAALAELQKWADWKTEQMKEMWKVFVNTHCIVLRACAEDTTIYPELTLMCLTRSEESAGQLMLFGDFLRHFESGCTSVFRMGHGVRPGWTLLCVSRARLRPHWWT